MVGILRLSHATWLLMAAPRSTEPILEQFDVRHRAFLIGVFISLVLIGLLLVACVMLGANWVRRLARHGRGQTHPIVSSANARPRAAKRPLLPEAKTGETMVGEHGTDETVADR